MKEFVGIRKHEPLTGGAVSQEAGVVGEDLVVVLASSGEVAHKLGLEGGPHHAAYYARGDVPLQHLPKGIRAVYGYEGAVSAGALSFASSTPTPFHIPNAKAAKIAKTSRKR